MIKIQNSFANPIPNQKPEQSYNILCFSSGIIPLYKG